MIHSHTKKQISKSCDTKFICTMYINYMSTNGRTLLISTGWIQYGHYTLSYPLHGMDN